MCARQQIPRIAGGIVHAGHVGVLIGLVERTGARLRTEHTVGGGLQDQDVMVVARSAESGRFHDCVRPRWKWPGEDAGLIDLPAVLQVHIREGLIRGNAHPRDAARAG